MNSATTMKYQLTPTAQLTADFINTTDRHIFLTGKAGTGKTTFLRYIVENTYKKTIVAAPTGIAAINAQGVTLHSLLQLPFGAFIPERTFPPESNGRFTTLYNLFSNLRFNKMKRKLIQEMELLIIDEVSMLRADLLDCIDHMLRHLRKQRNIPFGGVQMLFIGDLLQLPPVVRDEEWHVLADYYPSTYFFEAKVFAEASLIHVELSKIFRQQDNRFIEILNRFRENKQTYDDLDFLNQYYMPDIDTSSYEGYIHLTTHNRKADQINGERLKALEGKSYTFTAEVEGDFPDNAYPVAEKLILKHGAQVMFIKNDPSGEGRFFNGKIGFITTISQDEVCVAFDNGDEVAVPEYTWENKRYTLDKETNEIEEKVLGSFRHLPLKLAWAVTVHKSQGLTFEKAILDLSDAFTQGQVYVALSRLTSLEGLVLSSPIPVEGFDINESMQDFARSRSSLDDLRLRLSSDRMDFILQLIDRHFSFDEEISKFRSHLSGFNKQENRSLKQQFLTWTNEIMDTLVPLAKIGRDFHQQIKGIIHQKQDMVFLAERVTKAKDYFEGIISSVIDAIELHDKNLKDKDRLKTYRKELKELKEMLSDKRLALLRSHLFVDSLSRGKVPGKAEVHELLTKASKSAPKNNNKDKTPTREVSYTMFKEGKSIEEIAQVRCFVPSTIEGHLCRYVETGEISAGELMDEQKLQNILSLITPQTSGLGEIKAKLGDEYSYGEVKIAMAEFKRNQTK